MDVSFNTQFSHCPLIWVFYGRLAYNYINKLHERCLRIIYSNKYLSHEEVLEKDGSASLHHRNLRIPATEIFKVVKEISLEITKEVFHLIPEEMSC